MFFTRQQLEDIEDKSLASYGMRSKDTKGRAYLDGEPDYRTPFQRDRDRILHTTAFRRLEYKTQVFLNLEGDYFRTRLTHTLEVSQIGRTLARALGGNEDLVESICLAHDLGHSPFGHSGEVALARLMKDFGGFDHNKQSLRIVTELEQRYPEFPGLNLTWEVREGMVKHESEYDISDAREFSPELRGNRLLENSINGLFIKVRTALGSHPDKLDVPARLKSSDVVYVLQDNLLIDGGVGGYLQTAGVDTARKSGRLSDPGKIVTQIEEGLERGKKAIYPGEAKFLELWHTLAPRLWWKTVLQFEKR